MAKRKKIKQRFNFKIIIGVLVYIILSGGMFITAGGASFNDRVLEYKINSQQFMVVVILDGINRDKAKKIAIQKAARTKKEGIVILLLNLKKKYM